MNVTDLGLFLKSVNIGDEMYCMIRELYPICRSITGNGVRETLRIVKKQIPLQIHEVPTGTEVFDWTVPREWNISDAYVKDSRGDRVIDFQTCNLHVVNYSVPIKRRMSLAELRPHLFTLPDHPNWIPYRTSYYQENWGFCLSHKKLKEMKDGEYEVCIDSSLKNGFLTYGEYAISGQSSDEVLLSCHVCHPSLCNDNLSGIAVLAILAKYLCQIPLRYSYRFLFIPSTIGSITWLSQNEHHLSRIKHGLVIANAGDPGKLTYKKTRRDDTEIDKAVLHVLKNSGQDFEVLAFHPYGYDERQFCSPGFNLPVGCLSRTPHGGYPEYHTSADNLDFVRPQHLADTLVQLLAVISVLENNRTYVNQNPKCEPQLGRRGIYRGYPHGGIDDLTLLWILNMSDGSHALLDIAEQAGITFANVRKAAQILAESNLLEEIPE